MRSCKREYLITGLCTVLMPIIILCIVFAYFRITPFGNNSLIFEDFNNQYISYFIYLKHNFFNIQKLFYSYSLSLGGSFFGITTYYLLSPFNLLFIIFPVSKFALIITIITIMKISCLAVTMYFYLGYLLVKYRRNMRVSLQKYDIRMAGLLAVSFSLMSFIIYYKSNIMWLDSIILLPLIMLGLEKILDNKRPYLYIVTLFFSIILNYYIGFIICLFTGLFFIYRLSIWKLKKDNLNELSKKLFNFVIASGIGGALSACILIPSFESVRLNGAVPYTFSTQPRFSPLDILPMIFSNVTTVTSNGRVPSISCGLLVTIMLGLYFLKNKITIREKMISFIFLVLLVFSQSILGIYLIWHGFTAPNGFPDRNAFIFPFIFVYLSFRAWCYREKGSSLVRLFVIYVLGMLVLFKLYSNLITFHTVMFDLVLGSLIIGSLYLLQSSQSKFAFLCLTVVCTVDLTLNAYHWQKIVNQSLAVSQFNRYYSSTQNIMNKIKSQDTTFYRLGMVPCQ